MPAFALSAHGGACWSCHSLQLDRHRLLFGAAGATLASGLGLRAGPVFAAGGTDAMLLNCIDYRLTGATTGYTDAQKMAGKYDQVVLAGASLGRKKR